MLLRAGSPSTLFLQRLRYLDQCTQMSVEAVIDLWVICLTISCLSFPICKMEEMGTMIHPFTPGLQLYAGIGLLELVVYFSGNL